MTLPISYLRINSDVQAIEEQKELQVQQENSTMMDQNLEKSTIKQKL